MQNHGNLASGLVVLLASSAVGEVTYNIGLGDDSVLTGANNDCLAAFNTNVTCAPTIGELFENPYISLDQETLEALCVDSCYKSLVTHRDGVILKCKDIAYSDPADGTEWQPQYQAEWALMAYNLTCLKKSTAFCNIWFEEAAYDAENPACDDCYLKLAQIEAGSPAAEDPDEAITLYSSLSSSCKYTGTPATKTVPPLIISSPTGEAECDSKYEIKDGDTYLGVSQSQTVSTHDLITANGLNYSLQNFPTNGTLCIRNKCKVYVIKDGDTCDSIETTNKLNNAELRAWNPDINGRCDNVENKVNQTICVSNPGGDYTVPDNSPGEIPAPVPDNIAPNTTTNCSIYHEVQVGEDCPRLETKYSISAEDFFFLNPMLWVNCTNLWAETSYCVSPVGDISAYPGYLPPPPSYDFEPDETVEIEYEDPLAKYKEHKRLVPIANGTRPDCWQYDWWNDTAGTIPTTSDAAWWHDISVDLLIEWNPSLKSDGSVSASSSYCVALAKETGTIWLPPSPRAPDETEDCSGWFPALSTCDTHLSLLRLDKATFYKWNPSVGEDCSSFINGTYYCFQVATDEDGGGDSPTPTASVTSTKSTTSSTTKTTKTSSAPAPTDTVKVSPDGTCAGADGYNCKGSVFGDCCSSSNYCGSASDFCGGGCQTKFGTCADGSDKISPNGSCGGETGYTCTGSVFGACCSEYGYCGDTTENCGTGCQSEFGTCK